MSLYEKYRFLSRVLNFQNKEISQMPYMAGVNDERWNVVESVDAGLIAWFYHSLNDNFNEI